MSGDFVAQWVSSVWAALDGHNELDFCVSSLVWRLGAEHVASFCGNAANVTSWQLALFWQRPEVWLAPSVLRCYPSPLCHCSHSSGLSWLREPNQRTAQCIFGWVSWLALDLFELPNSRIGQMCRLKMAWKAGMAGPASCKCKLPSKPCLDWEGNHGRCF